MSYIVFAYRYGNRKAYNFPVGVFGNLKEATRAAEKHHEFRGGKYSHVIWECGVIGTACDAEEAEVVYDSCEHTHDYW